MDSGKFFEGVIINAIGLVFLLFPYLYICLKKGENKFLFTSACLGAVVLIFPLLYAFALPFGILMVKVIPQLAEYDMVRYILPLLRLIDLIQQYYMLVLSPLFILLLPPLIYKRYLIFRK